jgi:hypothetical protein
MDIQQLRSWIFELYDPLENDRQYIVYDADRGNLIVDVPRYSERAVRLLRGTGPAALLLVTNATRAAEAARFREALGVQVAAHQDDASAVEGGADIAIGDEADLRPEARTLRVRDGKQGATILRLRKPGGILVVGDLDLASPAAKALLPLEFSAVLSCQRPPTWNAGKETLLSLQRELPRPRKQFGILLDAPWDRAYKGRLEDKMYPHEPIVPKEATVGREAEMGTETLVVADITRRKMEKAPRPVRDNGR